MTANDKPQDFIKLFEQCVISHGEKYTVAEEAFLACGSTSLPFLEEQARAHRDPVGRTIASVYVASLKGSDATYKKIRKYFADQEEKSVAGAKRGNHEYNPRIDLVLEDLIYTCPPQGIPFTDALAPYMAVQVEKRRDWPAWKRSGMLAYILGKEHLNRREEPRKPGKKGKEEPADNNRDEDWGEAKGEEERDVRALAPIVRLAEQKNWDVRLPKAILEKYPFQAVMEAKNNEQEFWKNRESEKKAFDEEMVALSLKG